MPQFPNHHKFFLVLLLFSSFFVKNSCCAGNIYQRAETIVERALQEWRENRDNWHRGHLSRGHLDRREKIDYAETKEDEAFDYDSL